MLYIKAKTAISTFYHSVVLFICSTLTISLLASCALLPASGSSASANTSGNVSSANISATESVASESVVEDEDHYKDAVYDSVLLNTSPDADILYVGNYKDQILAVDQRYSSDSGVVIYNLTLFDSMGQKISECPLDYTSESEILPHISQTASGTILFEIDETIFDASTSKAQFHIWLQEFSVAGEKISSSPEITFSGEGGIVDTLTDTKGNTYVVSTSRVNVFDSSFNQTAVIKTTAGSYNVHGLCVEDTIYLIVSDGQSTQTLRQLSSNHAEFEDAAIRLNNAEKGYFFIICNSNIYVIDNIALYHYDWVDNVIKPLALLVNLICSTDSSEEQGADEIQYYPLSSGEIIKAMKFSSQEKLYLFKEQTNNTNKQRIVLTIGGCTNGEDDLKPLIQAFNATNSDYRFQYQIQDKDVASQNALEILTGNAPDIYVNPPENYLSDDYFLDLNAFLKNDPDVNTNSFPSSLLSSMKTKDKLFILSPAFSIYGLQGSISCIGDRTKWTPEEFYSVKNDLPNGMNFFYCGYNQNYFLANIVNSTLADYINTSGKISFNSKEFYDLLDFCMEYGNGGNASRESNYLPEESAITFSGISSLSNYNDSVYSYREPISVTGFPSDTPQNALAIFSQTYAISVNSEHADVCWDLLRQLFQDEYQNNLVYGTGCIPTTNTGIDYAIQIALKPSADDKERFVELSMFQNPISKETTDRFLLLIQGLSGRYTVNQGVYDIIIEESPPYFLGQKTAEDVADIITNRSQVLIDEQGAPILAN